MGAEQLRKSSENLSDISAEMASGADQTSQQARIVSENSHQISQGVNELSIAVEEMAANIQEISRNAADVMKAITTAVEIANTTNISLGHLTMHSQEIGEITEVITAITQANQFIGVECLNRSCQSWRLRKRICDCRQLKSRTLRGKTAKSAEHITQKNRNDPIQ